MDREEKIGLGTAVGVHGALVAAFALGLLMTTPVIRKPAPMQVTIFGEDQISSAPDAIQEEPAPAEAAAPPSMETVEPEVAEPEPVPTPVQKILPKPQPTPVVQKVPPKPVVQQKQPPKTVTVKKPPTRTPPKSPGFSKDFEKSIAGIGKGPTTKTPPKTSPNDGGGVKAGTPAAKTAQQVRKEVNVALGPQILRFVERCAPSGVDVRAIETTIALRLDNGGRLNDVQITNQTGVNDNNRPQAEPLKRCILQAARAASPYRGLDPDYYEVWKSHSMRLRPRS